MPLSKADIHTRLRVILTEAFDLAGLEELVQEHVTSLGARLEVLVPIHNGLGEVASSLVSAAEKLGMTNELIQGVTKMRGNRQDVVDLVAGIRDDPRPFRKLDPSVEQNVIRFNERFAQRKEQFRYLSGFKKLHETLHNLQGKRVVIAQAAERFERDPSSTLEIEIIGDDLQEDHDKAEKSRGLLEESADAEWVDSFGGAVRLFKEAVVAKDLVALPRVVEILKALPNQQSGLNSNLVRCARRLKPLDLVASMDQILAGLTADGADEPRFVAEFRDRLNRFRSLCDRLSGLILDHDACQRVETSLTQVEASLAQGEVVVILAPELSSTWEAVGVHLKAIAARRPGETPVGRVVQLGDALRQAASAAQPDTLAVETRFTLLLERFRLIFLGIDRELLKITDQLVQEATFLDVQLRTATNVA